jgi:histidinol-phosphatase (PHP family)
MIQLLDSHMHTPLCRHAVGQPEEYATVALSRGLTGITFTCHAPMPEGFHPEVRMSSEEFDDYVALVTRAAEAFRGQLDIRLGLESDWLPGMEKWLTALHQRAPLHHVLGSVHYFSDEYREMFFQDNVDEFCRTYFEQLADSAESGLFDTLAHPDLIKNFAPDEWQFEKYQDCIETALARIARTGVAMELNTSGLYKPYAEVNPGPDILSMMCDYQIPVVLGSDSHRPGRVAEFFDYALHLLEAVGYEKISYFVNRQRHDISIHEAHEILEKPPTGCQKIHNPFEMRS